MAWQLGLDQLKGMAFDKGEGFVKHSYPGKEVL
jgi:hypothetical protein